MKKRPTIGCFFWNTFLLLFLSTSISSAQKVVKKTLLNEAISTIAISTNNCYKVVVNTYEGEEVIVDASIEGEYKKDLLVLLRQQDSALQISADFQPIFRNPNDKLSAHKVVSISLDITIPKNKKVFVKGENTILKLSGVYQSLQVNLKDGLCSLFKLSGFVKVHTQNANIVLVNSKGVVNGYSKYGMFKKEPLLPGKSKFVLESVTGDIAIR